MLAARVAGHNLPTPQPITEPGQPAVTDKRVGQEVARRKRALKRQMHGCKYSRWACVFEKLTAWRGSAVCRRLQG